MAAQKIRFGCAATLALTACGVTPGGGAVDTAKVIDAIKSDEVRWNADLKSGDAAKVAAHYAPDGLLMTPGAPPAVKTAAIRDMLNTAIGQPGFSLSFASDHVDVSASGDVAVARGAYRKISQDGKTGAPVTEIGSYVTVYKPQPDGAWKAVLDINTPTAATPTPQGDTTP